MQKRRKGGWFSRYFTSVRSRIFSFVANLEWKPFAVVFGSRIFFTPSVTRHCGYISYEITRLIQIVKKVRVIWDKQIHSCHGEITPLTESLTQPQ